MKINIIILFLLVAVSAGFSQTIATNFKTLKATKNNRSYSFNIGNKVFVKQTTAQELKVRGTIVQIFSQSISIKTFSKDTVSISLNDIEVLRRIKPQLKIILSAVGTVLTVGGILKYDQLEKANPSSLAPIVYLPVVGLGIFIIVTVPSIIISERIQEKKTKNGWQFVAE